MTNAERAVDMKRPPARMPGDGEITPPETTSALSSPREPHHVVAAVIPVTADTHATLVRVQYDTALVGERFSAADQVVVDKILPGSLQMAKEDGGSKRDGH